MLATTIIVYLWILGLESNWKTKHCILLGISIGFCLLTYYNAYGYILCSIILCLTSVILKKMRPKQIFQKVLIVCIFATVIAGWWFIRNAIIYDGDILGIKTQNEYGDKYALEGYKPSTRITIQKQGKTIMDMLIKEQWLKITVQSFIGVFGYHSICMSYKIYGLYLIIWLIGIIGCLINFKKLFIYKKEENDKYLLNYIFVISIIISISLSVIYSYASDFQPQGRYIMGIMIPFTYFIVNGIQTVLEKMIKSDKIRKIIVIVLILLLVIITLKALFGYIVPAYK